MWCESETRNKFLLLFFPCLHPYLSFQNEWMVRGEKWGKLILFFLLFHSFLLEQELPLWLFFLVWWLDWLSFSIKSSQEATYNIDIFTINLLLTFSIHFNLKKRIRPVELIIRQIFLFFVYVEKVCLSISIIMHIILIVIFMISLLFSKRQVSSCNVFSLPSPSFFSPSHLLLQPFKMRSNDKK